MISVIVCSAKNSGWNKHMRHIESTIGFPYEYIRIDNTTHQHSLSSAYNQGVKSAKSDLLVFVHEDVFFLTPEWGAVLWRKFINPQIGIVGVAGSQLLLPDKPMWVSAGSPFIHGNILHHDGSRIILSVYSQEMMDTQVVAVDGLFMAVRKSLFHTIRFDEETFDGFHFYDLDICMQIRRTHSVIVTHDILVKHLSKGVFDKVWGRYGKKLDQKSVV